MMEIWDPNDLDLVSMDGTLTADGMTVYWESVDRAVAFNVRKRDEFLSRIGLRTKENVTPFNRNNSSSCKRSELKRI